MEKLRNVLAQEDTVLFIGSGISVWSGLPSWPSLIEELAKFLESAGANADLVRAEASRGDLLQAASYGFDKLTKTQIGEFIRAACHYGVAKPSEIHRKLISLGPRCFVTTNYDNLLEEGLRLWQPDRFFRPPITNRQLTETAEIVHARALDFVFKPHGDAGDIESIILTREQYRQLLPQGERHSALESLKTLLTTRPVVYFGFGLRDPDFLYVRDLLANIYKGGTRDHYAIMADVSDAERDYWRGNYGIHLVSYSTTGDLDGGHGHAELLTLLDSLLETLTVGKMGPSDAANATCTPEIVLSLARHAARLARAPMLSPEFPIRVHAEESKPTRVDLCYRPDKFDHYPIDKFLDDGPEQGLLVGLPGAGKTYALRRAAARLADKLNEVCLSEPFNETAAVVPILVDLKLYRGDLADLVSQSLPRNLPFDELMQQFTVKIFLDSFNEMPREHWENGAYEADFTRFLERIGRSGLIVGSRTSDGLDKLGLQTYSLDQIDEAIVVTELKRIGVDFGGRFNQEVLRLLQKPFYFQLVLSGTVSLPTEPHPRDFYQSFFLNINQAFTRRFGKALDLEDALALTAYEAINRGEEAFPLVDLLRILRVGVEAAGHRDLDSRDIANWLVANSVLLPQIGSRISFVHQSVTEYLAARELARRYQATPQILREKLVLARWDQALFLALSLLPPPQAEAFFRDVVSVDFALALNAVKYLELGRDDVVSKLLAEIPKRIQRFSPLETDIENIVGYSLPISDVHETQLRIIMSLGNMIGAAAVKRLVEIRGNSVKEELLNSLVRLRDDFNYCCNGVAIALQPLVTPDDIRTIFNLAESIAGEVSSDSDDNTAQGFIVGAAGLMAGLEVDIVKQKFLPSDRPGAVPEIHARILCDFLWNQHSTPALEMAGELLLRGINRAATAIYFISSLGEQTHDLSWTSFNAAHIERLISLTDNPQDGSWALNALQALCSARPDLAEVVSALAAERTGLSRAYLLYCATSAGSLQVFEALGQIVNMSEEQRSCEPLHVLEHIELNWLGEEKLFVQILKLREKKLALSILDPFLNERNSTLRIEIGPIEWWLDWIASESDPISPFWFKDRLSRMFSLCLSEETRHSFVVEFNKPESKYRAVLARSVLLDQNELSTEDFSEDAISFLLADLAHSEIRTFRGHLLGRTATEKFVSERLLALVHDAQPPLSSNLQKVLREAGKRHGQRYITD